MKTAIIVTRILGCTALLIAVFFLIRKLFYHLVDRHIAEFQSDLINKQTEEIQNIYRQMQAWRHDYRNHIQNMKNRLGGDQSELEQYLDELADDLVQADTSIRTGNVMADAVLNSKLSVAKQKGVRLNIEAHIPRGVAMTDVELCSILGNLLDNAIEACEKLSYDQRYSQPYTCGRYCAREGRRKGRYRNWGNCGNNSRCRFGMRHHCSDHLFVFKKKKGGKKS